MESDRIASAARAQTRRPASATALVAGLVAAVVTIAICTPARALIVGTTPGSIPNTSADPLNNSYWGAGEGPTGWANAAHPGFSNGVYIGDGWILTAWHIGTPAVQFDSGATFQPIPNQDFQVLNPANPPSGVVQQYADLRLFRLNGDPGLPSVNIASQSLVENNEAVMMGWGVARAAQESHWSVSGITIPPTWTKVGFSSTYNGYESDGGGKRWGTNRVANSDCVLNNVCNGSGNLKTVVNGGTIAYLTTYDQGSGNPFEAQVVGGDSGTGVFYKRSGQWELAGIVLANYIFNGQYYVYTGPPPRPPGVPPVDFNASNTLAVYGNASALADLSSYRTQIMNIINAHQDYSAVADLNLDGVSGAAADIADFVAGWRYNNGTGQGTITSWMHGDVTHDGKTDVNDFLRMRSGLSAGAGAELTALLGSYVSGGIPEPSAIMLVVGPALFFALRGRCRRPRRTA